MRLRAGRKAGNEAPRRLEARRQGGSLGPTEGERLPHIRKGESACPTIVSSQFVAPRALLLLLPLAGALGHAATAPTFEQTVQPFLAKHCYACHNAKGNSGGLNLQDFTTARSVLEYRDEWEKVSRRISSGQMPPKQMPRPDAVEVKQVVEWIQSEFDRADKSAPGNR